MFLNFGARSSNRHLLLFYGFAQENNPKEHVYLKLSLEPYLDRRNQLVKYKIMPESAPSAEKKLPSQQQVKIFKISRGRLNLDIIYFVRNSRWRWNEGELSSIFWMNSYEFETSCLQSVRQIFEEFLQKNFIYTYEQNEQCLTD